VFHAKAHVPKCQRKLDATFMEGTGVPNGERCEMAWSTLGVHGQVTQYQSPSNRESTLEHVMREYEAKLQNNTISLLTGWYKRSTALVRTPLTTYSAAPAP
jgi:aminoglycoside/choline kinase family phosphotransferase